jgi:hypothetical protein
MPKFVISQLNPVNFVNQDKVNLEKYYSMHMDDFMNIIRRNEYQQSASPFLQIWSENDTLNLQVITDAGTPQIQILNSCGRSLYSVPMIQKLQNTEEPSYYLYESSFNLNLVSWESSNQQIFYIRLTAGTLTLISEPMVMTDDLSKTLLIEYKHRSFYNNMVFEQGFYAAIRIKAILAFKQAAAKDTFYEDQVLDMVMLKSKPYRIFELTVGVQDAIPDFMIDKLNRIFGCSDILIDGKYYAKNDGAKWEEKADVSYHALKVYSIELRESTNKENKIFDTVPEQSGGIFTPEFEFQFQ